MYSVGHRHGDGRQAFLLRARTCWKRLAGLFLAGSEGVRFLQELGSGRGIVDVGFRVYRKGCFRVRGVEVFYRRVGFRELGSGFRVEDGGFR